VRTTRDLFGLADLRTDLASVRGKLATDHTGYYNFVNADAMRFDAVPHVAANDWGGLTALIRNKIPGHDREFMLGEVLPDLDQSDGAIARQIGEFTKPPANISSVLNFLIYKAIRDLHNDAGKLGSVRNSQLTPPIVSSRMT
jgi:hypothetical protein